MKADNPKVSKICIEESQVEALPETREEARSKVWALAPQEAEARAQQKAQPEARLGAHSEAHSGAQAQARPNAPQYKKLIFADMDGTFLASDKSVPQENLQLLDRIKACGSGFVPCTGRPLSGIEPVLIKHPACDFVVCANGAAVHEAKSSKPLYQVPLNKELAKELYAAIRDREITFDIFGDDQAFSERFRYQHLDEMNIDAPMLAALKKTRKPVDADAFAIIDQVNVLQRLVVYWKFPEDKAYVEYVVDEMSGLTKTSSHPKNVEISDCEATKGNALSWLCEYLKLPLADAIAFGDAANDLSMLAAAGEGVAMKNAGDTIKAQADFVAPGTNDESGIVRYLAQHHGI